MSKEKKEDLRKDLLMMDMSGIKPNFTALGRKYALDPRTIKKYYEGYEGKPSKRNKKSKLDDFKDTIIEKMSYEGSKMSAVHFYLKNTEKDYNVSYSTLTAYIRKHSEIKKASKDNSSHVRYETEPGEQLQFDWVESIQLINKYGVVFEFNVFSAELSYSRLHYFRYSKFKTKEDVLMCLIETFKYFCGVTESVLTDNMSSIVNTKELKFCSEFIAFAKDFNMKPNKCKVRHAYTKGKVEVRNKFMKWLIPYNYSFETEEDLVEIIKKINIEVNNRVNSTTNMKPILLYDKEKEYLHSLPNNQIIEHYMNLSISVKVQNTSLIYYKGIQYSVPPKYINKTLKVKEIDNKLHIYDNTNLVTIHEISDKKINYKEEDYKLCLQSSMPQKTENEIEALAKKNLELMNQFTIK